MLDLLALSLGLMSPPADATLAPPTSCPATSLLEDAQALVPVNEDTRPLRAEIGYALGEARASEQQSDQRKRLERCRDALRVYADVAKDVHGEDLGAAEAARAESIAANLDAEIATIEIIKPKISPEQKRIRRRRGLVAGTAVTGVLTSVGMLMATIPWMVITNCRNPDPAFGCGEGYSTLVISTTGGALALVNAIPLLVLSVRLHRLDHEPPPGVAVFRGRGRLELGGLGLQLRL